MLTSEQIKKYKEDGYVVSNFVMPEEDLLEIEKLYDSLVKKYPEFRNYCPAVLLHDESFLKYCFKKEVLDSVEQLVGNNFALWNTSSDDRHLKENKLTCPRILGLQLEKDTLKEDKLPKDKLPEI